jgi:hypothetical protein
MRDCRIQWRTLEEGWAGQGRAGQGRAGQGRAGQGSAGQGRAGQGSAGQSGYCQQGRILVEIVGEVENNLGEVQRSG